MNLHFTEANIVYSKTVPLLSYTQRRRVTVIYSLKPRPVLLLPLVNTFLTLAVTFTSLVYFMKIHYHVITMACDVTWCKHSSKTDLLSIWSYKTHIEASWPPWKQAWFATFVVLMTIVWSLGHVLMVKSRVQIFYFLNNAMMCSACYISKVC